MDEAQHSAAVPYKWKTKHLWKTAYYHLRNIAKLRPALTLTDAEKLVLAFVSCRLDYCNALLIGSPNKNIQRLQHIQNSAARILLRVRKYDHITPVLKSLHWLPIPLRIECKLSLISAFTDMPPNTQKNYSPSRPPHAPSVLQLKRPPNPQNQAPHYGRWGRFLCSFPQTIWGPHRLQRLLNVT